ncbi:hypothetical protein KIW84_052687 [Lathyrus oleraceus]|uniref:Retrovirus-related Pol polyprotein from transposon TNT 1-94-like beta-barrel domain-containing protein n=1 Tax=Pisum sativum TaxID=3888 RepID=A0A9D4WR03_PEA|nr:hypothetical protein KIW84_052687 [Pisum sativum]
MVQNSSTMLIEMIDGEIEAQTRTNPVEFANSIEPSSFNCDYHYICLSNHSENMFKPKLIGINKLQGVCTNWCFHLMHEGQNWGLTHVSYDKTTFKTYTEVNDGQEVQMGNEVRAKVVGTGSVELNFTSGKKVTLVNVLHVPDMNRSLVSRDLLRKPGIKSVYESGKLILTHNGIFVGKGYSAEGMIKLCTTDNIINKISNSC